jgi:hypothetical protein
MKFETKYLIRWGIPGWVLVFWIVYYYLILKEVNVFQIGNLQVTKGLTLLISLTALGVPIGYILHQLYFGLAWVLNKNVKFDYILEELGEKFPKHESWGKSNREDYFQLEYVWHMVLLNQSEEVRKYLEERYRHLLGNIHGLGALFMSQLISLIFSVIVCSMFICNTQISLYSWIYLIIGAIIQIAIFLSAGVNYIYYSDNLRAFQTKVLKTFLKASE